MACCNAVSRSRTAGSAEIREANKPISGFLIASDTSSPAKRVTTLPLPRSWVTTNPATKRLTASPSVRSTAARAAATAAARYMAPVSIYRSPSLLASSLATELLPAPEGPSMAIT
jgi:hypothetical protein